MTFTKNFYDSIGGVDVYVVDTDISVTDSEFVLPGVRLSLRMMLTRNQDHNSHSAHSVLIITVIMVLPRCLVQ